MEGGWEVENRKTGDKGSNKGGDEWQDGQADGGVTAQVVSMD